MGMYGYTGSAQIHLGKAGGVPKNPSHTFTDNDITSLFGRSITGSN